MYPAFTGCWLAVWIPVARVTGEVQSVDGSENSTTLWAFIRHYAEHHADERPALEHDVAWLTLNVSTGFNLEVWAQSHQCWKVRVASSASPAMTPFHVTVLLNNYLGQLSLSLSLCLCL